MDEDGDRIPDHKLCGFLRTVLSVAPPYTPASLPLLTRCNISDYASFVSENGVVLTPIDSDQAVTEGEVVTVSSKKKKKKWSSIGLVNGSLSVVHQLHALVTHECVEIVARVVAVAEADGKVRVVLLVDVYLSILVLFGKEFPWSGTTAAALFKHLSCDWAARSSILKDCKSCLEVDSDIWNISPCHVFACKQHYSVPDASTKRLFELHEIFKSLPSITKKEDSDFSRVIPEDISCECGIWVLSDDLLIKILAVLRPIDLVRFSATCRHIRSLAAAIMPCMKLKLFPHQQSAVEWMLQRERRCEVLQHPLWMDFITNDEFSFFVNSVSGEIVSGEAPTIKDFRGGMFCDEPGLGKTVTALSLILKTHGSLAEPPEGAEVIWCNHSANQRCGYYEINSDNMNSDEILLGNRVVAQNSRRGQLSLDELTPRENLKLSNSRSCLVDSAVQNVASIDSSPVNDIRTPVVACSSGVAVAARCTKSWSHVRKNLLHSYEGSSPIKKETDLKKISKKRKFTSPVQRPSSVDSGGPPLRVSAFNRKRSRMTSPDLIADTWVQCDACRKWRKIEDGKMADTSTVWFCSMNTNRLYQKCSVPEESWGCIDSITYFPGFHAKGTPGGIEENISFFTSVLKEHCRLINSNTKRSLIWMAKLSPDKLSNMERSGLVQPVVESLARDTREPNHSHKIFEAFGLVGRTGWHITRWYYPKFIVNLIFDLDALRIALCKPFYVQRLYLSRETLIVVPSNLVDHWRSQIEKHVSSDQLRVKVWTDHKKPSAHRLAWDYDVVITTFSRLSAEWSPHKRSVLMQVHWLRVMLDEGHTLGSSLTLTNKLQMAVSLRASYRWLLTGTPTPNTPLSQLSHLQPMLRFLHEEAYGKNQKSWETAILRPFEEEIEEGRLRLLQLLRRCMISARKEDLKIIPPCIKKVTYLDFAEEHARSYNELVETVRRNILMADWNDPAHIESLLNPKQWKFRSATIKNLRLSCCVAGHVRVSDAGEDIQETMDILVESDLDPISEEYALIRYNLINGGNCMRCKEWCRLPVITPCRHLLCLDCVSLDSEKCAYPGCSNLYEMESPETLTRPENPDPKWPVPKDLIELQPSYKQDEWHPDWESTSSSKVNYLIHRLKEIQEANHMLGYSTGKEGVFSNEAFHSRQTNDLSPSLSWTMSDRPNNEMYKMPPVKVIIFSQFLEHINIIEQQLKVAGIQFAGLYNPLHSSKKMKSLESFQHDENCMALLMDGSAALGLDFSFVTHVYLMEPIWDKSMEEQVISRAHRMGATRPVHVETLAMNGTIEEQMLYFLQDADECRRLLKEELSRPGGHGPRALRSLHDSAESNYLNRLSFVRNSAKA